MKMSLIIILAFFLINNIKAQSQLLYGSVKSEKEKQALLNANIYWFGTQSGTTTDENGEFSLAKPANENLFLIVSFIGYKTDTILIKKEQIKVEILLSEDNVLSEVVVGEKREATYISKINPIQTQIITSEGLQKMACCNLSESFENNATVDVSYPDAVTGAKQIQMLGLAGIYSQIITENNSSIRGLSSSHGLGYIPGTWMESIQISKGASTVVNGYESITGLINIELKKPEKSEPFHLNLYANEWGKAEANITSAYQVNKNLSTMVLLHGENYSNDLDKNKDSFLDLPKTKQVNVFNRWNYNYKNKFVSQLGIKILNEDRLGGQKEFLSKPDSINDELYKIGINSKRYEAFYKAGLSLNVDRDRSIALLLNTSYHEHKSYFGNNKYNAYENALLANFIYQSNIINCSNKISTGISFSGNHINETFNTAATDTLLNAFETVPGIFLQYTYFYESKFNAIAGIRTDFHNEYGVLISPRLHLNYKLNDNDIFKTSVGRGFRRANIIAENIGVLATSKKIVFIEDLAIEDAWNYGVSFTKYLTIKHKKGTIIIDAFRTEFVNQIIVDMDSHFDEVSFYNLTGKSYSNSIQVELIFEPFEGFEINTAFRYNDVKTTINNELLKKPFVNKYKGLLVLSYATKHDKWKFDFTSQYIGQSRLPETSELPQEYRRPAESPAFFIIHSQITRQFKKWNIYVGVENITNYRQSNPIIAADNPFGKYFDTTFIWGPITGRSAYIGIRYTIK